MVAFPRSRATFVAVAFAIVTLAALLSPSLRPSGLLRDFGAFYCAGKALRAHADPYRAEPLGACELTPKPAPLIAGIRGLAMPAPLPPYGLAPFRLIARLPYVMAALVWTSSGIACVALTVFAMRRVTGLPIGAVALALALTDGYASLCLGQIAPIAIAAIAVAAWLLKENHDELAACSVGIAMIEPHIALPACATLFIFRGRARLPLVAVATVFAGLSILVSDLAIVREYVTAVLPAHALSEVANEKQFSLTYALFRFGVAPAIALRVGEYSYLVMVALGIVAARAMARRNGPAAYALFPPALAVIGGPFVHIIQIAAALPATLLLAVCVPAAWKRAVGIALVLLAIPWIQFANLGLIFVALAAIVTGVLTVTFVDDRPIAAAVAGAASIAIIEACIATVRAVPNAVPILVAHYHPSELAEVSWALYVRTIGTANAAAFDLAKLPTLAGLAIVACATYVEASSRTIRTRAHVATGGKEAAPARRTGNA